MKRTLAFLAFFISFLFANGQTPFPEGIRLLEAQEVVTADSIPVMDANGTVNKWIQAANLGGSTGLEAIDEGNGIGYRFVGTDATNRAAIGLNAVDLIQATGGTRGASGKNAIAIGLNTTASGTESFAGGTGSSATSNRSFAFGVVVEATSEAAAAFGNYTDATGQYSFAAGDRCNATARAAVALGQNMYARSNGEIALGYFGTNYAPNNEGGTDPGDRRLNVGNGNSGTDRHDAFTILKSGYVGIGYDNFEPTANTELLQVNGDASFNGDVTAINLKAEGISAKETPDTSTVVYLDNAIGNYCNMSAANTSPGYTLTDQVTGGLAIILINALTEPTITGATKSNKGISFTAATDLLLHIKNYGGSVGVKYWFEDL